MLLLFVAFSVIVKVRLETPKTFFWPVSSIEFTKYFLHFDRNVYTSIAFESDSSIIGWMSVFIASIIAPRIQKICTIIMDASYTILHRIFQNWAPIIFHWCQPKRNPFHIIQPETSALCLVSGLGDRRAMENICRVGFSVCLYFCLYRTIFAIGYKNQMVNDDEMTNNRSLFNRCHVAFLFTTCKYIDVVLQAVHSAIRNDVYRTKMSICIILSCS